MNYKVIYLESVDSTNVYLKNLCSVNKPEEGTVILADHQTHGKGQGLNTWYSSQGLNITMSILFHPFINVSNHFILSEFISLGLVDLLSDFGIDSSIKWPNDIYVDDRKIAGILVENSIQGKEIVRSITGIGLNINETEFPLHIPNPVSMKLIMKGNFDKNEVMERLISKIFERYKMILSPDDNLLHDQYNQLLYRKGQLAGFQSGNETFQGTILNVEKSGEFIIRKETGQVCKYLHGDITYLI